MKQKKWVKRVSRSFSLSLLSLPKAERTAVGLTYLLARYADTLTDCGSWSQEERLAHLESWENAILKKDLNAWKLTGSLGKFESKDAEFLVEGTDLLRNFFEESERHQEFARELLKTLLQGMKFDLKAFEGASANSPVYGCKDEATFDYYCFLIAGCVGRYWVQIFGLPPNLELLAVAYGKGLQRINIIRDVVEDWGRGRVYLPKDALSRFSLDRGEPWRGPNWRDYSFKYIQETKKLLVSGLHFCESIPDGQYRLRFASSMPLRIGLETLKALEETSSWERRIKISRSSVRSLAFGAMMNLFFPRNLSSWSRKYFK